MAMHLDKLNEFIEKVIINLSYSEKVIINLGFGTLFNFNS